MNLIHAGILGIVEGITEFLPISSTGHLILATRFLGLSQTEFSKTFDIAIQAGAILAVLAVYGRSFFSNFEMTKRVAVAFIPTAIFGFFLYKIIKNTLLGREDVVLASLFIGGVLLIVFEWLHREKDSAESEIAKISYKKCLWIGLFQSLAIIPGVSRSGATIVGGLLLGLKRETIVEFSFLLAVPTMLAATGFDILKNASSFSKDQVGLLLVGCVISFIVALLAIQFLLQFIKQHSFMVFGVYRIFLALLFWIFL